MPILVANVFSEGHPDDQEVVLSEGDGNHVKVFTTPDENESRMLTMKIEDQHRAVGKIPGESGWSLEDRDENCMSGEEGGWNFGVSRCSARCPEEVAIGFLNSPDVDVTTQFVTTITGEIYTCGDGSTEPGEPGGSGGSVETFTVLITDENTVHIKPNPAKVGVSSDEEDRWIKLSAVRYESSDSEGDGVEVDWKHAETTDGTTSDDVKFSDEEGGPILSGGDLPHRATSIWAKSSVAGQYTVKANTVPGGTEESSGVISGELNIVNVVFNNAAERNLPALDDADLPEYDLTFAVAHDEAGSIDLEESEFLEITPSTLSWSDVQDLFQITIAQELFDTATIGGTVVDYDDDDPDDTDIYSFGLEITHVDGEVTDDDTELEMGKSFLVIFSQETQNEYDQWLEDNDIAPEPDWWDDLPKVYSRLGDGNADPEPDDSGLLEPDDGNWNAPDGVTNMYHYNAAFTMRSHAIEGGYGHQAAYDGEGNLISTNVPNDLANLTDPETLAAAGTADLVTPNLGSVIDHADVDVWPFIRAAQLDGNPIESTGIVGPTDISDPIIIIGENLLNYFQRRPPLTTPAAERQVEPGQNSDPDP